MLTDNFKLKLKAWSSGIKLDEMCTPEKAEDMLWNDICSDEFLQQEEIDKKTTVIKREELVWTTIVDCNFNITWEFCSWTDHPEYRLLMTLLDCDGNPLNPKIKLGYKYFLTKGGIGRKKLESARGSLINIPISLTEREYQSIKRLFGN